MDEESVSNVVQEEDEERRSRGQQPLDTENENQLNAGEHLDNQKESSQDDATQGATDSAPPRQHHHNSTTTTTSLENLHHHKSQLNTPSQMPPICPNPPKAPPLPDFLLLTEAPLEQNAINTVTSTDQDDDNTYYEDTITFADVDEEDEIDIVLSTHYDLKALVEEERMHERTAQQMQEPFVDAYSVRILERRKHESKHHQIKNTLLKADQVDPTVREAYRTSVSSWKVVVPKRFKHTQVPLPADYLFPMHRADVLLSPNSNDSGSPTNGNTLNHVSILKSNLKALDSTKELPFSPQEDDYILRRLNSTYAYSPAELDLCGKTLSDIPYRILKSEKFLFTARHLSLKLGKIEPLFCRIALYDSRNEVKVSEDFCFHLNSLQMSQWMDKNLVPEILKYVFKNPRSLMSVSDVHEDVHLVLFIEKVLQDTLENVTKPYLAPERVQDRNELREVTKEFAQHLSYFHQVIAWGYSSIFQPSMIPKPGSVFKGRASVVQAQSETPASPAPLASPTFGSSNNGTAASGKIRRGSVLSNTSATSPTGHARNPSGSNSDTPSVTQKTPDSPKPKLKSSSSTRNVLSMSPQNTPTSPRTRTSTILSRPKAPKPQHFLLRDGTIQMPLFRIFENFQTSDLFQLLNNKDTIRKRCKQIPGSFVFELTDADSDLLLDDEDTNPLIAQPLDKMFPLDAHIQSLKCEQQLADAFRITRELPLGGVPRSPYVDYVHMLYVYPESLNLTGVTLPDVKHPRNLCVKVMLRKSDGLPKTPEGILKPIMGEEVILPKYWDYGERSNDRFYLSNINYHRKQTKFLTEEVKISLPPILSPTHHLLFAVYHVSTDRKHAVSSITHDDYTGNARKKLIGYAFAKLLDDRLNPRLNESFDLPLYQKLDDHYLIDISPNNLLDKRANRKQLKINLRCVSSILPSSPSIYEFFKLTSNLISTIDSNQKNKRILAASVSSMLQALSNLARTKFDALLPYFSSIMDALLRLLARIENFIKLRDIDKHQTRTPHFNQIDFSKGKHSLDDLVLKLMNETFACLLSTLMKAGVHFNDFSRSNQLLSSYVDYVFTENDNNQSWTFLVLTEHWLQLMTTDETSLSTNYSLFTKTKLQKVLHNAIDYSLELSWFFFDIISKSLLLFVETQKKISAESTSESPSDEHDQPGSKQLILDYSETVEEFSSHLHPLVQHLIQSIFRFATSTVFSSLYHKQARKINRQLALFLSQIMNSIPLSGVIPHIHSYVDICEKYDSKVKFKSNCGHLRLDFFRILLDNNFFVEANRPESVQGSRNYYITNVFCILVLRSICIKHKSDESSPLYLEVFLNHLTKFDSNAAFSQEDKNQLCSLYFPFIQRLTQVTYLMYRDEEPDTTDEEHIHPFDVPLLPHLDSKQRKKLSLILLFLLKHTPDSMLEEWLLSLPHEQTAYFIKYLTLMLDSFRDFEVYDVFRNCPVEKSHDLVDEKKKDSYACLTLFSIFNRVTKISMPTFVQFPNEHIRSVEACVHFLASYMHQNEFNLDVLQQFLHFTFKPFVEQLKPIFAVSPDKCDCRWQELLGCILRAVSFSNSETCPSIFLDIINILCDMYLSKSDYDDETEHTLKFEEDTYFNIMYDDKQQLKAASLNKLIEHLVAPSQSNDQEELELRGVFFLTFRSFTTPDELLNMLLSICRHVASTDQQNLHMNIISLLTYWLNHHFYDFSNNFVVRIVRFLSSPKLAKMEHLINQKLQIHLIKNLLRHSEQAADEEDTAPPPPQKHSAIPRKYRPIILAKHKKISEEKRVLLLEELEEYDSHTQFDILEWSSLEIARQLTLIDYEVYSMIQPKECFNNAWSKQNGSAPNIVKLTYRFNRISLWVATVIIQASDNKERKDLIVKFIEVCRHALRGLRNYNVANSILSGLRDVGIFRLRGAWDLLSLKEEKSFDTLCKALSHDDRYRNMRNDLDRTEDPCIPFLGVYLTDLTFIEDGNPDNLKVELKEEDAERMGTTRVKLINMAKRRLQSKVIREMLRHQSKPYSNIRKVEYLYESLLHVTEMEDIWDKERIYQKSLEILPRGGRKRKTSNTSETKSSGSSKVSSLSPSPSPHTESPLASTDMSS